MPKLGRGRVVVTCQTTETKLAYIIQRAERLGWTKTKASSRIIEMWFDAGCPPLSVPDSHMPKLPFSEENSPDVSDEVPYENRLVR